MIPKTQEGMICPFQRRYIQLKRGSGLNVTKILKCIFQIGDILVALTDLVGNSCNKLEINHDRPSNASIEMIVYQRMFGDESLNTSNTKRVYASCENLVFRYVETLRR